MRLLREVWPFLLVLFSAPWLLLALADAPDWYRIVAGGIAWLGIVVLMAAVAHAFADWLKR